LDFAANPLNATKYITPVDHYLLDSGALGSYTFSNLQTIRKAGIGMIKTDILNNVAKIADITRVRAVVAVEAILDAMKESMRRGERIELRGFGVFQVKPRKKGIGRNPRTGTEVRIPPGKTIRFKPGKNLRNLR
jgi:DNA-binding protein HU-beta